MKYFKCDPEKYCKNARCCNDSFTIPSISIGDYVRLADHTGESITNIWRTKGNLSVSRFEDMDNDMVMIGLSLIHDPCPYLKDSRCSVHEARPITCAHFPYDIIRNNDLDNFKEYGCLQNIQLRPRDISFIERLENIITEMACLDIDNLSKIPKGRYLSLKYLSSNLQNIMNSAVNSQAIRDPEANNPSTIKLVKTIEEIGGSVKDGKLSLNVENFKRFIGPLIFAIDFEWYNNMLKDIDEDSLKEYRRLNRKYERLLKDYE